MRTLSVSIFILILALTPCAWSAERGIEVSSDALRIEERTGEVSFEGNVRVRFTGAELTCDSLTVRTSMDDPASVKEGVASGDVVLKRGADRLQAGKAVFDIGRNMVEFTGSPTLLRADSTITASRIAYSLEDGTAAFEGPVRATFDTAGER